MKLITSWDDGSPYDLRLADLLEKYNIPGVFYIPIKNQFGEPVMSTPEIDCLSTRFPIGGHTYNHTPLTKISLNEAREEIATGKHALEDIIQKEVDSFCYPCGFYNENIVDIVKEVGFKQSRSARLFNLGNSNSNNFVEHPNLHLYPHSVVIDILHSIKMKDFYSFKRRLQYFTTPHIDLCTKTTCNSGGTFHLWGHSWEVEKFNLWDKLESILKNFSNI